MAGAGARDCARGLDQARRALIPDDTLLCDLWKFSKGRRKARPGQRHRRTEAQVSRGTEAPVSEVEAPVSTGAVAAEAQLLTEAPVSTGAVAAGASASEAQVSTGEGAQEAPVSTTPVRCPAAPAASVPAAPGASSPAVQGNRYLAKEIKREADRIEQLGQFIGMFELATWSALRKRDLVLIQGTATTSLIRFYEGTLGALVGAAALENDLLPATVAGCFWDEQDQHWASVHDPSTQTLTHYVVAARFEPGGSAPPPSESVVRFHRLNVQLMQLGYAMIPTVAAGDCGIEALCFFDAGGAWTFGNHPSWRALRRELAAYMRAHRHDTLWQDLFSACAEESCQRADAAEAEAQAISSSEESSMRDEADEDDDDAGSIGSITEEERAQMRRALGLEEGGFPAEPGNGVPAAPPAEGAPPGVEPPAAAPAAVSSTASAPEEQRSPSPRRGVLVAAAPSAPAAAPAPVGAAASAPVGAPTARAISQAPEIAEGELKPCTFAQFVARLSEDDLRRGTASLEGIHALEDRWKAAQPEKHRQLVGTRKTVGHKSDLLTEQLKLGRAFQAWLSTAEGKLATAQHRQRRAFLVRDGGRREKDVPDRECSRLKRAWDLALDVDAQMAGTWKPKKKQRATKEGPLEEQPGERKILPRAREGTTFRKCGYSRKVPPHLQRRRKGAGSMRKCPELGEALWDWFVDIRHIVKARIRPSFVQKKAAALGTSIVRHMRARGVYEPLPRITPQWVVNWRRHYGVSLVLPGKRFKLSRQRLLARLKVMWMGNLRVRLLAMATLKRELIAWGIDQKPLYMCESGSKNMPALCVAGEVLELKENTAHTRMRISAMTTVTSDKEEAQATTLPLELLFKADTDGMGPKGILRPLHDLKTGCKMTFQTGPKGSYRLEHVLRFLDSNLPLWTEERKRKLDWRLLYLDAYAAHLAPEVRDLAWERGFVVRIHGAGTTGDVQVNDTHLHAPFAHKYREFEMEGMVKTMEQCPGDISRRREDVVTDAALTWRALDHTRVAEGHLRNGLTNALDHSQDEEMSDAVKAWWTELGLYDAREASRAEIYAKVEKGELRWDIASIKAVDPGWGDTGVGAYAREGAELDEVAAEGEALVLPDDSEPEGADTDVEKEDMKRARAEKTKARLAASSQGLEPHEIDGVLVPKDPEDTETDLQAAQAFATKQKQYEELIALASSLQCLPTVAYAKRRLQQHLRSAQGGADSKKKLAWRYWQKKQEKEKENMHKMQQKNLKIKRRLNKRREQLAKLKRDAAKKKAAREQKQEAEAKAREEGEDSRAQKEISWNAEMLGQGKKNGGQAEELGMRGLFLSRARFLYPLPPDKEAIWKDFRERFPAWIAKKYGQAVGSWLLDQRDSNWIKAAELASGKGKRGPGAQPVSFATWVAKMHKAMGPARGQHLW